MSLLKKQSPEFNGNKKTKKNHSTPKPMGYRVRAVNFYFKKAEDQTRDMAQPLKDKAYNQKDKNPRTRPLPPEGPESNL